MVVYNTTSKPIFICTKFRVDPDGGPGIQETTYLIAPGSGIELNAIGLKTKEQVLEEMYPLRKKITLDLDTQR